MIIRNIQEAETLLATYIPAVKEFTGQDITLERIQHMMELLDNPQDKLKIIHVAGTSGKTSTSYYLARLLQRDGAKVGLTVSPHIRTITERLQVNMHPITEQQFCDALAEFLELIKTATPQPSYFELLIAFAYWYFAKIEVDYAVIETGFGGLHDATNIAQDASKICVITDIGIDHTKFLGTTLPAISEQKAGIIHKRNQVFMYEQAPEITAVFRSRAAKQNAILSVLSQDELAKAYGTDSEFTDLPTFQQRNWLLARYVAWFVAERDGWQLTEESMKQSLKLRIPGRMDVHIHGDKTIILDGAHNEQKMGTFVTSFRQRYPHVKPTLLLSLKADREYQDVLPLLLPISDELIVTSFDAMQDLPIPSMDPTQLADAAKKLGFQKVSVVKDSMQAYEKLLTSANNILVVTGSFYLVSLINKYLEES